MRRIEVCCTSVADVIEAYFGGAIRIELCSALSCGGVTPSRGLIAEVLATAESLRRDAPRPYPFNINVLVRPREGSFCYSGLEIGTILSDIRFCADAGVSGIVVGALTPEGDIDTENCRKMMEAAKGLDTTFHRAFDACADPERALEQIAGLGFRRLLTSGQKPDAISGAGLIHRMVIQAGDRITIMPGSGISPENIAEIERITGAREFHSTASTLVPDPCMHRVPELGFEESSVTDGDGKTLVRRTSRSVVRQLAGE